MKSHFLKHTLLLSGFLSATFSYGQTDGSLRNSLETGAFKMTKATVEFLATDSKTFGYGHQTRCADCANYDDLKRFAADNRLTRADELVNDAQKQAAQRITALTTSGPVNATAAKRMANEFNQYLQSRVTSGEGRTHRSTLPSFPAYQQEMNQLAVQATNANAATDQVAAADLDAESTTESVEGNESAVDSQQLAMAGPMMQQGDESARKEGWIAYDKLALLLSLVNLGLLLYFMSKSRGGQSSSSNDRTVSGLDSKVAKLEDQQNQLNQKIKTLQSQLSELEGRRATNVVNSVPPVTTAPPPLPAPQPARPVQQPQAQAMNTPANTAPPKPQPVPAQPAVPTSQQTQTAPPPSAGSPERPRSQPVANQPKRFFARTADLGDGFSVGGLLAQAERGTVYEITATRPNTATFRVSENPEAQQLALSDPYSYLSDACTYENQPSSSGRIQTVAPGQLVLQGDKWKIEEKARIGFV